MEYFITENGANNSSCSREGVTKLKEEERAIILGLSEIELKQQNVVAYGSDVDLFVFLLAGCKTIDDMDIQMKSLAGYISIAAVHEFTHNDVASALLPFHTLGGCDGVCDDGCDGGCDGGWDGGCDGGCDGGWDGEMQSLAERAKTFGPNDYLHHKIWQFHPGLLWLNSCCFKEVMLEFSKFICRLYCPQRTPKRLTSSFF